MERPQPGTRVVITIGQVRAHRLIVAEGAQPEQYAEL
jgi:hypothetical protein